MEMEMKVFVFIFMTKHAQHDTTVISSAERLFLKGLWIISMKLIVSELSRVRSVLLAIY